MTVKELVKDNIVKFDSFRQGNFYYNVGYMNGNNIESYQFTVPLCDIGQGTMLAEDKAIYYMRWIRAALNDGTLIKL